MWISSFPLRLIGCFLFSSADSLWSQSGGCDSIFALVVWPCREWGRREYLERAAGCVAAGVCHTGIVPSAGLLGCYINSLCLCLCVQSAWRQAGHVKWGTIYFTDKIKLMQMFFLFFACVLQAWMVQQLPRGQRRHLFSVQKEANLGLKCSASPFRKKGHLIWLLLKLKVFAWKGANVFTIICKNERT